MKIDILLATYNGEKYLEEQLESILNQSFTDFRLLISDDGSTDSTREILNKYAEKDDRIVLFFQSENLGVVKNFEFLMNKVESEYFMFSDQDDVWKKDKISNSINLMVKEKSDLVYSDLEVVDGQLNLLNNSYWKLKGFTKKIRYNNFESLFLNNYITGSTMLVKSKWLEKILPLPHNSKYILHDYWTALIVSKFGKMSYLKETQVMYRQHDSNEIGSKKRSDQIKEFDEMRNLFIDVKKDHFETFANRVNVFEDDDITQICESANKYFKNLENIKLGSFKNTILFWKLYKYENFVYAFENYLILNFPKFAKILFKLKKI